MKDLRTYEKPCIIERMFGPQFSHYADALFRVRVTKMTGGERLPLVVDRRGLPVPNPNQWALFIRRPQVQQNTLIAELRTIAHVHDWAARRGLDIDARFAVGSGLSPAELLSLYQNLRYVRAIGRKAAAQKLIDANELEIVKGQVHATRVGYAREYLLWALERALYRLDMSDSRVHDIRERCERVRRTAIDFQRSTSDRKANRIGLNVDQRTRLLEIVNPTHRLNPFMRSVRYRNWTLILLLLTFGFRRGESLKLYVTDVNVKGRQPSLTIHRRPGDIEDTRANEPAVKTLGRKVPLSPEMTRLLDVFIMHHRPRFPGADMSPFLFLSEEGQPLSLRSANSITERIVRCFPEFAGVLSPHVLRYTYNDMLVESAQAAGVDGETLKASQNYLNGWSLDSEQGSTYARRAIERRAGEISIAHQRSLFS